MAAATPTYSIGQLLLFSSSTFLKSSSPFSGSTAYSVAAGISFYAANSAGADYSS